MKHADFEYADQIDEYNRTYEAARKLGQSLKHARGAARQHLPLGFPTRLILSGNHRAWRDFIAQRASAHADGEIRAVALAMLRILADLAPGHYSDLAAEHFSD